MTTAKSVEGDTPQSKRTRTSTVSYPYHPLELCIQLAESVKRIGNGRSEVSRSMLASSLGISEQSSDFAAKIASSKTFGLIHGKSSFLLSPMAREYFFPTENGDVSKKKCLLKFFSSPGAYQSLVERYDGTRPPSIEIISNILGQEFGIPESWKSRVAAQFLKSAQFVGALGSDGFLRYKVALESLGYKGDNPATETGSNESERGSDPNKLRDRKIADNEPTPEGVIVWKYPCGGKFLRVETPETMTKEIWEKLNKYIQILEP